MWPFILSDRLLIVALVGLYPHQLANQTQAHLQAEAFSEASFSKCLMRYSYIHSVLAPLSKCCPHLEGRLLTRYSPVRHLVFTEINTPFDLHVLSTPPAFVLSQDQTLHDIWKSVWLLFIDWYYSLFDVLYNRTSHVGVHSVHCSVFKGHRCHRFIATTCISYQTPRSLSSPDLNFFQLNQCRSAKRTHTDTTKQTYRFFRPSQYSWFLYNSI